MKIECVSKFEQLFNRYEVLFCHIEGAKVSHIQVRLHPHQCWQNRTSAQKSNVFEQHKSKEYNSAHASLRKRKRCARVQRGHISTNCRTTKMRLEAHIEHNRNNICRRGTFHGCIRCGCGQRAFHASHKLEACGHNRTLFWRVSGAHAHIRLSAGIQFCEICDQIFPHNRVCDSVFHRCQDDMGRVARRR